MMNSYSGRKNPITDKVYLSKVDPDRTRGRQLINFVMIVRTRMQNVLRTHDESVLKGGLKKDSMNVGTLDEVPEHADGIENAGHNVTHTIRRLGSEP